jgi:hypothetical protein
MVVDVVPGDGREEGESVLWLWILSWIMTPHAIRFLCLERSPIPACRKSDTDQGCSRAEIFKSDNNECSGMSNIRHQHREGILTELQKVPHEIRSRYGVIRIGLLGSAVRGELSPESDIDLLVELDPEKTTFRRYLELEEYLTRLFDRKIDLVTLDGISPYVLPYIQKDVIWCER